MRKKFTGFLLLVSLCLMLLPGAAFASDYAQMEIEVNGNQMVINSDYPSEEIPEGFYETLMTYQGQDFYGGLDTATETVQLFHLRCDANPALTGFYQLMQDGSFVKYSSIFISGKSFSASAPTANISVPTGYVQTDIAMGSEKVTAYQKEGATGDDASRFIVYGSLNGGANTWYSYDQSEETIQKFAAAENLNVIDDQNSTIASYESQLKDLNEKYNKDIGRSKNLFLVTLVLCVLFFFLMLNAMMKRRHERMDLEDRITDLKRHGGVETQRFSRAERSRNRKRDAKAEERADLTEFEEDRKTARKENRDEKRQAKLNSKAGKKEERLKKRLEAKNANKEKSRFGKPLDEEPEFLDDDEYYDDDQEFYDDDLYEEEDGEFYDDEPGFYDDEDETFDEDRITEVNIRASLEGRLNQELNGPSVSDKKPVKGLTEDMAAAMRLDETDDFSMDIIDLE